MTNLYESEFLKIGYDEDVPCLLIVWRGFTTSENFRQGVDKIIEWMIEKKATKTLTDLTEHRVISTEDQEYAAQVSVEFSKNYWKVKRAIITPKDVFTRFGIKQVNNAVAKQEEQERRMFVDASEAKIWLKEEENQENSQEVQEGLKDN